MCVVTLGLCFFPYRLLAVRALLKDRLHPQFKDTHGVEQRENGKPRLSPAMFLSSLYCADKTGERK